MSAPRVSICVPTYRGAGYISATIESVRRQSLADWELVIIDDNSPDDTAAVVMRHVSEDRRIRYHRNSRNLGPEGNWNRALEFVRGKYFKLLPHDDLLTPDCLQQQVEVLEQDTDGTIALVFGEREVIGPDGRPLMRRGPGETSARRIPANELVKRCVRAGTNLIGEPGSGLVRSSDIQRVGAYDARHPYVVDLDFWLRFLRYGDAYYTGTTCSAFRVSAGQWSVAIGTAQHRDFMALIDETMAQSHFRLTPSDRVAAAIRSRLNTAARLAFYALVLPRHSRRAKASSAA